MFGGMLGIVAAGVWALDSPDTPGELYYLSESDGGDFPILPPDDPTFTGAGFFNFTPISDGNLPVPLWLAIPAATALVGAGVGAGAAVAGVRISRI